MQVQYTKVVRRSGVRSRNIHGAIPIVTLPETGFVVAEGAFMAHPVGLLYPIG